MFGCLWPSSTGAILEHLCRRKSKTCRIRHLVSTVGPDIIAAGHPSTLNLDLDLDLDLDLGADSMSSSEIGRQRW